MLLAATCVAALLPPAAPAFAADPGTGLNARARAQIAKLAEAKAARTVGENKIETSLLTAAQLRRGRALPAGVRQTSAISVEASGRTRVAIRGSVTPALLERVRALGGQVLTSRPEDGVVSAEIPVDAVAGLADLSEVRRVSALDSASTTAHVTSPAAPPTKHQRARQLRTGLQRALTQAQGSSSQAVAGSVVSEGDRVHGADRARSKVKVSGVGVTVGVLSDGVRSLAASVASGNLPADVRVLANDQGDEGTAMLEIVHDMAPAAKLGFATADIDTARLRRTTSARCGAAGCDVIVDDVLYFNEVPFQDGPIARAVNDVTADGAFYFSSAGNEGTSIDGHGGQLRGRFRLGPHRGEVRRRRCTTSTPGRVCRCSTRS